MVAEDDQRKRHFVLKGNAETAAFSRIGGGKSAPVPDRARAVHGRLLLNKLDGIRAPMEESREIQEAAGINEGLGLQIVFESFPDVEIAFNSLAREASGIELLNVKRDGQLTFATVFVPDGKLTIFENLVIAYLDESKDLAKGPKNHNLINTISDIRAATIAELWTDDPGVFPVSDDQPFWWEVWLPVRGNRDAEISQFRRLAEGLEFSIASGELCFPERTVVIAYGSAGQMKRSIMTLNSIAELRKAKETADFFDSLLPSEQSDWLDDLLKRSSMPSENDDAPHVCLFDTGVNQGHPLLTSGIGVGDLHTVEPAWGTEDTDGHGTAMAALALYGDLTPVIDTNLPVDVLHRIESVKLLTEGGANGMDARHHGYLTIEATARPEVTHADRMRVFALAVTTPDNRDRGRPSSWSAAIDSLAADVSTEGECPRLYVVSAGNVQDSNAWALSPSSNSTDGIHDPAQSWNALTVGATTELVDITEPDAGNYQPIAPVGGLSPFSTTSVTWQDQWPLKPDVVFEGGNAAMDAFSAVTLPSLSLLTAHFKPQERLFTTANATSAATMLGARASAILMSHYPELWPETIRALLVHSAEWTEAMQKAFLPHIGRPNKTHIGHLIRHCGFGIPNLERAVWSVENSLTMIAEDELTPFKKEGSNPPTLRDMRLHRLPWPLQELEALGETNVEMRVTLSYFIEPNPSERGFSARYRYESHGLRFDVKRATESDQDFLARINASSRNEEERTQSTSADPDWLIGTQNRHRGSLHSDIWRGTAADLASRGVIGVYPTTGWWKTRYKHERYNLAARYSLLVSIRAPDVNVQLYSAVENQIVSSVEISG